MLSNQVVSHDFTLLKGKGVLEHTGEELVDAFKKTVELRNQMGGAMYWGMINEECHMLYDACRHKGVDESIMSELFGVLR